MNTHEKDMMIQTAGVAIVVIIAIVLLALLFTSTEPVEPPPIATPTFPSATAIMHPTPNAMATYAAENHVLLIGMATAYAAQATDAASNKLATWAAGRQTQEAGVP